MSFTFSLEVVCEDQRRTVLKHGLTSEQITGSLIAILTLKYLLGLDLDRFWVDRSDGWGCTVSHLISPFLKE